MVEFFPKRSNNAPSVTCPAIGENFEDFTAIVTANAKAASDIRKLA